MMYEIKELRVLDQYCLWLRFSDGFAGVVDLSSYIGKGFSADLKDTGYFAQAFIEPGGGVAWSNGYDMCPNFLRSIAVDVAKYHSQLVV